MPFIKIMGKNDNKKKVKKANVKEFPVDSALEQEKKNLNSNARRIRFIPCSVSSLCLLRQLRQGILWQTTLPPLPNADL